LSSKKFRRDRAMKINWAKARLLSSRSAISSAIELLDRYNVLTGARKYDLMRADFALADCLQDWDDQVWKGIKKDRGLKTTK